MTELLYLKKQDCFEHKAIVKDILFNETTAIILEKTIFYPQGGGQPYDIGEIKNKKGNFVVSEVRFIDGKVHHIGFFSNGIFDNEDEVVLVIDKKRRELNSKLHSAGHLLDEAIYILGYNWKAEKGQHFPNACSVSYKGELAIEQKELFKNNLEKKINELINNGCKVYTKLVDKNQLKQICRSVPSYIPDDKPCRVVIINGDKACPCGGTHVSNLKEIEQIKIKKVTSKKGIIRVSYKIKEEV